MSIFTFQQRIEQQTRRKMKLKINDNRQTMLSVRWDPDCTMVSLHRMFLEAPVDVMEKLSCYIRKKDKVIAPEVKAYIETSLRKLDYSHKIKPGKIFTQGTVYNLRKIYRQMNAEYFNDEVDLLITWFGRAVKRQRNKVTFGLYNEATRLIKIHRMLDNASVPDYVIAYVVFHEMLHNVCPTYVDEKGIHRIHNKEFKERELQFKHFDLAQQWIKEQEATLFGDL